MKKQSLLLALGVLALFLQNCTSDNKKTVQPTPAQNAAPVDNTTVPPAATENAPAYATAEEDKRLGPPGYVTRENIFLQTEPKKDAPKIQALKQYEILSILETIMTNPEGKMTDYPTWYRVELSNKKRGWVVANSVSAGGGG